MGEGPKGSLGGQQQQVHIRAARLDQCFSVWPGLLGASQSEQRARGALPGERIAIVHLQRAPISLQRLSVQSLRRKPIAGQHQTQYLVATASENAGDLRLSAIVQPLRDQV